MANVTANGISIEYETFGDPTKPALALIMGLGAQMIFWQDDFCRQLMERGFHVVRFDNRDVGLSQKFTEAGVPNMEQAQTWWAIFGPPGLPADIKRKMNAAIVASVPRRYHASGPRNDQASQKATP